MNGVTAQRMAAKAFIVRNGTVLIVREAETYEEGTNIGKYQIPGGRIEIGEPFFEALKREAMEETGLTVTPLWPLFVGEWTPTIKGKKTQIIALYYVCETESEEVRLSEEHDDFKWIDPKKIADYNLMSPEPGVFAAFLGSR